MEIKIIRSRRKTLGLQVDLDGVTVRAPVRASDADIRAFVKRHEAWIKKHLALAEERKRQLGELELLTETELRELTERAREYIPQRVAHFAPLVGVSYGKITIRRQKTRWGSCTADGNMNFNCLLMLTPPEVIDSVVCHELCHRKQMNHSKAFYSELYRVCPNYKACRAWLKENGGVLLKRLKG